MNNSNLLLRISLISIILLASTCNLCRAQSSHVKWNTWFIDNPRKYVVAEVPSADRTKAELQDVKQAMSKLDDKKIAAIKYWDAGTPAHRWNQIAPVLINQKMETMLRTPTAWMNMAIYDAIAIAWNEKNKTKRKRPHETDPSIKPLIQSPQNFSYPCEHSVTAAAAANVLAYFFPEKGDSILQLARSASQSRIDAGVQFRSDAEAGWELGEQVAKEIIEKAKNDGSLKKWDGALNKDPKKWTGTYPMGINLTLFTPIVIRSADQFRPGPPPDFESEMKDLKNFKQTARTTYQAHFWANNGGFDYWSELAAKKMFENRIIDAPSAARIYAALHVAFHEATIAIMDAKYAYWGIRPDQYDNGYKPMIQTPPFPGYPSGHAAGAATTAAVLEYYIPADAKEFRKIAKECADSRFYAGIHFRSDNEVGTKMGSELGNYVVETLMKK